MRLRSLVVLLVVLPVIFGAADPRGRPQGKITGTYTGAVAGDYAGVAGAIVTDTSVTINVVMKQSNGTILRMTFGNMPLNNKRFSGTAYSGASTVFITGRVDVPAGSDSQQTEAQSVTARISGNLTDGLGKTSGRLMCIQDVGSRGPG